MFLWNGQYFPTDLLFQSRRYMFKILALSQYLSNLSFFHFTLNGLFMKFASLFNETIYVSSFLD